MRRTSFVSLFVACSSVLGVSAIAYPASAEPSSAQPAQPIVVEPAPGQAAASAPSPEPVAITATCTLGDHYGVDPNEARTAADVVCHELARRGATNTQHEVRFGRLGGRTLVTLASRSGNAYDERRAFVTGLDEINVAGPRLASALAEGKPVEETRNVDNVLASETQRTKVQRGSMAFDGGFFGSTTLGVPSGASAGFDLGLAYRAGSFGLSGHGRAGGIGSSADKLALASLDVGGRYYLSSSDVAPFAGVGLGISYFQLDRDRGRDLSGSGFGAYAQLGVEMLRSHHVAFSLSVRADAPFYALEMKGSAPPNEGTSGYVLPLSLNAGLVFH